MAKLDEKADNVPAFGGGRKNVFGGALVVEAEEGCCGRPKAPKAFGPGVPLEPNPPEPVFCCMV